MAVLRCPQCGGSVTRVRDGKVSTWVTSRFTKRDEEPRVVWRGPVVFDACDWCEWAARA